MRAAVLEKLKSPLVVKEVAAPLPKPGEVLIRVSCCSLCRTDLHIIDGDLIPPHLPLILGHQIVGTTPDGVRVGVPWLGSSCGACPYCIAGDENLCDKPTFTGFSKNGGFAEYVVANKSFIFPLPGPLTDIEVAPWLCAGMIGYRALGKTQGAKRIGFYGFGAAAHLLIQVARHQQKEVYAFTRPGDLATQGEAKTLGAVWAGDSSALPPQPLDAAILFAPVGELVPLALKAVRKKGIVVCAEIHMSDIPSFPYPLLWEERTVTSVANLTRKDGHEFLRLAPQIPLRAEGTVFPLEKINEAIAALRAGTLGPFTVVTLSQNGPASDRPL